MQLITFLIFVLFSALIVWLADWTSSARHFRALAVLNQRLVSGEIDQTEYEEKRKLIKSKSKARVARRTSSRSRTQPHQREAEED